MQTANAPGVSNTMIGTTEATIKQLRTLSALWSGIAGEQVQAEFLNGTLCAYFGSHAAALRLEMEYFNRGLQGPKVGYCAKAGKYLFIYNN